MSASISRRRYQPPIMYRTLPTTLSLELRMQSYDNFLNPPNFRRSFFFREPHSCVWHLLYIGVPRSHSRGYLLLYIAPYPLGSETSTKKLTSSTLIVKTCSLLKALQTPPKTRSFELRVQRYYNFPNPPNFRRSFFFESLIPVSDTYYI